MIAKRYVSARVGTGDLRQHRATDTLRAALVGGGDLRQQMSLEPGQRHHGQLAMGGGVLGQRVSGELIQTVGVQMCVSVRPWPFPVFGVRSLLMGLRLVTQVPPPVDPGVTLANWRTAQFLQWSFQHVREVMPTARVSRGTGAIAELRGALRPLTDVVVGRLDGGSTTVGAIVGTTYTDGFMVLHDGRVLAEDYPAGMTPETPHALMSVTKSLVGSVAGVLVDQGALDPAAPLTTYVPALAVSGYAGATVRHVLDMRSGIIFSEDYLNPNAEIRLLEQCIGWSPRRDPSSPASLYDLLLTLRQGSPHGGPFAYRSCETDALGWACEQAAGARMPELMADLLWSRLGVEHDADMSLDSAGAVIHDGGLSTTMRDLARFGQMLLDEGQSMTGERVLPAWWIRDSFAGDPDARQAFAAGPTVTGMPGGMYHNQFWFPYADRDILLCLGIHGQMVYVNPGARVVGVKLSSWPVPQDPAMLAATLQAFDAIAANVPPPVTG